MDKLAGQSEEKTGNKRGNIKELRGNSRKKTMMYSNQNVKWPFFILKLNNTAAFTLRMTTEAASVIGG